MRSIFCLQIAVQSLHYKSMKNKATKPEKTARPSALLDTRVIYCGDNLEQLREDRTQGFFVSFDYSSDVMSEIQAFMKKTGKIIRPITVKDILDESRKGWPSPQIAYKLA
jgi:hypothetical protein